MLLSAGTRLGSYEVVSAIGAGGMGEVYQALDTRLGRSVAIKVLPEMFARDGERIARFHREAKALAALNHSNIATLYGFEETQGTCFLVMELVGGETLADRIARGPIPVDEALKISLQMVEALESAHEKGVIHRDLKPANVKLTSGNKVKVLDFGLAKFEASELVAAGATTEFAHSPTLSLGVSNVGVILGTAGYMSPEQAKGAPADLRSDIFSFGCVLYEMLTGRQPFHAETIPEVLAGVLARDADLKALPASIDPRMSELLQRCLEKNPRNRWHAAADLRVEIEDILTGPQGTGIASNIALTSAPVWRIVVLAAVPFVLAGSIAAAAVWASRTIPEKNVSQFRFSLPENQTFASPDHSLLAMAPDGSSFAYAAAGRLYLRRMNEFGSTPISGSDVAQVGPVDLAFSPDGKSVVFFSAAEKAIKRIAISGGSPITICQVEDVHGTSWTTSGDIVFGQGGQGIKRVPANGGTPTTIVSVGKNEQARSPQVLPGGAVLFTLTTNKSAIVVQQPGSDEHMILIPDATDARYLATGHLVYTSHGSVMAVPFDAKARQLKGGSFPLNENIYVGETFGLAQVAFSETGTLAYIFASLSQARGIAKVDRSGMITPLNLPPNDYDSPRISPDGKRLAVVAGNGNQRDIFVYSLDNLGTSRGRLTYDGTVNWGPVWAGDNRLLFASNRHGTMAVFSQRIDIAEEAGLILGRRTNGFSFPESWSSRSQAFLFTLVKGPNNGSENDVAGYDLAQNSERPLVTESGRQQDAVFSPDGNWFAYGADEGGGLHVWARRYAGDASTKKQVTQGSGHHPVWSRDGREIFYVNAAHLFSVGVTWTPTFSVSPTPAGLPIQFDQSPVLYRDYDISPDGSFIVVQPRGHVTSSSGPPPEIHVVLNWFEKLQASVATP